jgi:hypothetical protein
MCKKICWFAVVALISALPGCASVSSAGGSATLVAADHFVSHTSTLPSLKGQPVGLFVRQKASAS